MLDKNDNINPASSVALNRRLIASYGQTIESKTLTLEDKYKRIAYIADYLEAEGKRLGHDIQTSHAEEINIGTRYFQSIKYSPELHEAFRKHDRDVAWEVYARAQSHEVNFENKFEKMDLEKRLEVAKAVLKVSFNKASFHFVVPLQRPGLITFEEQSSNAHGKVPVVMSDLEKGDIRPIELRKEFLTSCSFPDLLEIATHEANHHYMLQFASLAMRGKMSVLAAHEQDLTSTILTVKERAIVSPCFYKMYRANPLERLAYRSGEAVRSFYLAHQAAKSELLEPCSVKMMDLCLDRIGRDDRDKERIMIADHLNQFKYAA